MNLVASITYTYTLLIILFLIIYLHDNKMENIV